MARSTTSGARAAGGIDLLLSFDTTGSMSPCIGEVRRKASELVRGLFQDLTDLRVGVIAHGDYCDKQTTYDVKMLDLTDDPEDVIEFINGVERTGGGDAAECYELVLHTARSATWKAARNRVLVMMGDDVPHPSNYPENTRRLDWRNERSMLNAAGIAVYAVQCLNMGYADQFWSRVGDLHLRLNQFQNVGLLIRGIGFKQAGPEAFANFEAEVRSHGVTVNVEVILDGLAGRTTKRRKARTDGLIPVDPARFQIFEGITGEPQIRDFVESNMIEFKKGRGFYPHVTRRETIQAYKEVILEDLRTGEMFTGEEARRMIGLPDGVAFDLEPNPLPGFRVWVQSTSVNRKLRESAFMYEVSEKAVPVGRATASV